VHAGDRFAGDNRPTCRHDHGLAFDCHRQHEAAAVVDMLADQVDPAGRRRGDLRLLAEEVAKNPAGPIVLVCHGRLPFH
jgi:hypothetical protein